jgi:hypothetical protein
LYWTVPVPKHFGCRYIIFHFVPANKNLLASWRTPICRRALGLLLWDWSSGVLNHSSGSIQTRWETLSVKQDSCLWWLVRDEDTAPNAPNDQLAGTKFHAGMLEIRFRAGTKTLWLPVYYFSFCTGK